MASAHVVPNGTNWNLKGDGALISTHRIQEEALSAGRQWLRNHGGGELFIHGEDGAVRAKDTVAPGNDPRGHG